VPRPRKHKVSLPKLDTSNTLIVVPAYNEERALSDVLTGLLSRNYRCVVVDDGSSDGTSQVAKKYRVSLVRLPFNCGVGAALRAGFRFAESHGYEAAVQFDADGQHNQEFIEDLISVANSTTSDLIVGSRFLRSDDYVDVSRTRRLAMNVLARMSSHYCGTTITDSTSGFRLVRRPLLQQFAQRLPTHYLGDTFEALVLSGKAGYSVCEVPTSMNVRSHGRSSTDAFQAALLLVRAVAVVVAEFGNSFEPKSNSAL